MLSRLSNNERKSYTIKRMIETGKMRLQNRSAIIRSFQQSLRDLDSGGSMIHVALSIALIEYPQLNRQSYVEWFDSTADEIMATLENSASAQERVLALNRKLFDDLGSKGNGNDYFDSRNSFLNMVIERRLGIPITLSLVYMELGKRIGLELRGVGLP